jgi:hypothetical protein
MAAHKIDTFLKIFISTMVRERSMLDGGGYFRAQQTKRSASPMCTNIFLRR